MLRETMSHSLAAQRHSAPGPFTSSSLHSLLIHTDVSPNIQYLRLSDLARNRCPYLAVRSIRHSLTVREAEHLLHAFMFSGSSLPVFFHFFILSHSFKHSISFDLSFFLVEPLCPLLCVSSTYSHCFSSNFAFMMILLFLRFLS